MQAKIAAKMAASRYQPLQDQIASQRCATSQRMTIAIVIYRRKQDDGLLL